MKRLIFLIALFPCWLYGQEITVKGVVRSTELNETLPGATIRLKGTDRGTVTDVMGNFEIQANMGDVLIFSFVGMQTLEQKINGPELTIVMEPDYGELDEVVVVSQGYFDVAKEDLTGSIVQIGSEELEQVRANTLENLLQGQVAGVVVNESAEPGGGIGISIRGTNSMLGGTQPLYVVDGIPINPAEDAQGNDGAGLAQSSLNFLNPNDIEKIEVMKDAAATAIYGARGANGVVIITTKTADKLEGKHKFNIVVDQTLTQVNKQLDVLSGPEFENYMNQRVVNQLYVNLTNPNRDGLVFDGTQALTAENFPELSSIGVPYPQTTGVDTDWQDLTYRMARSNSVNLSYAGGNKGSNLTLSLGLLNNQGVIVNSDFNRVTFNMNAKRDIGAKFQVFSKTNVFRSWGNATSTGNGEVFQQRGVVSQTLLFQPIFDLLAPGEDDEIYAALNEGNIVSNPYTLAQFLVDEKKALNLLQSFSVVYKLDRNLKANIKGAYNFQRSTRDMYYPSNTTRGRRNNGEASQSYFDRSKGYLEANLRFQRKFGQHGVDAIVIGTYEQTNDRRMFSKAFGFGNDVTSFYTFESATDILVPINVFSEFSLISGVARAAYNFKRKYFLDLNGRIDASSKFAANQRSAFFPSASAGWIVSRESFLKDISVISFMKLRASYGQTGSNPIAPFQSLSLLSPIRYNFDNSLVTGYFESNISNPDLTWETTTQYNIGMDLNLFEAKLQIVVDAYLKETNNLLQLVRLPASNGYESITDNFGSVENKGIDLSVGYDFVNNNQFQWSANANFSMNRNKLLSLNANTNFQLGPSIGFAQAFPIMFMEGRPLGVFWGAETDGIYADWEEALASGIDRAAPGEIKYVNNHVDVDANGNPLETQLINFDDYVQIGDPNPDFTYAITNNLRYGRFDLSFLITGQQGGDIFWADSWQLQGMNNARNVLTEARDQAWRSPFSITQGEEATFIYDPTSANTEGAVNPAPLTNTGPRAIASDRQVFDGTFVRLKNVNLGYTHAFKSGQNIRLYVSGRNLLTRTNYPGYDPEIQTYNKDPQRRGVDLGSYPGVRSYIVGVRCDF